MSTNYDSTVSVGDGEMIRPKRVRLADNFARGGKIREHATDLLLQVYGIDRLVINLEEDRAFERGADHRYSSTIVVR